MAALTHQQADPGGVYWFGITSLSVLAVVLLAVLFALSPWNFGPGATSSSGTQGPAADSSQAR